MWATASALPQAAGQENVGLGDGSQFITGECLSDADCASACCALALGTCAARAVAEEGQGCGFGGGGGGAGNDGGDNVDGGVNDEVDVDNGQDAGSGDNDTGDAVQGDVPGAENVGQGDGSQFITGACVSDADCASGCCATLEGAGVCSAEAVQFEDGKQGCGFQGGNANT